MRQMVSQIVFIMIRTNCNGLATSEGYRGDHIDLIHLFSFSFAYLTDHLCLSDLRGSAFNLHETVNWWTPVLTLFLNLSQTWLDSLGCFAKIVSIKTELEGLYQLPSCVTGQDREILHLFLGKWSWQVYPGLSATSRIHCFKAFHKKIRLTLNSSFPIHYFLPQWWVWNAIRVSKHKLWVKKFTSLFIEARYLGCKEARYRKYA